MGRTPGARWVTQQLLMLLNIMFRRKRHPGEYQVSNDDWNHPQYLKPFFAYLLRTLKGTRRSRQLIQLVFSWYRFMG
jgi:hypothetical protein